MNGFYKALFYYSISIIILCSTSFKWGAAQDNNNRNAANLGVVE